MTVDEKIFYREATRQILSTLDIEKAMQRCLIFLRNYMPADQLLLFLYDPALNIVRKLAVGDPSYQKPFFDVLPLPDVLREELQETLIRGEPVLYIANNEEGELKRWGEEIFNEMKKLVERHVHQRDMMSNMTLSLAVEGKTVAHLVLAAEGLNRYTEEHGQLFFLLNDPFAIAVSNSLAHQEVLKLQSMLEDDKRFLQEELHCITGDRIIGEEFGLNNVIEMAQQVAGKNSPVLLYGETGVGKDMIANFIHFSSPRKDRPFIKVNCGAIPDTLIDSELFGHEKGAFTGAVSRKRGRFDRANGGTIFLDEIGELPLPAQVRLLRVLQNKEFERVGGSEIIRADVRIIVATNRNLDEMVGKGEFREDLYFRLNVFPILIPPLRQRKIDIPALVHHFLDKKTDELKIPIQPKLAPTAMQRLVEHDWPGNVRELENLIERELILNKDGVLRFNQLIVQSARKPKDSEEYRYRPLPLDEMVAQHIQYVLKKTGGQVHGPNGAARLLGINPSTLRSKMKKLGIPYGREFQAGKRASKA